MTAVSQRQHSCYVLTQLPCLAVAFTYKTARKQLASAEKESAEKRKWVAANDDGKIAPCEPAERDAEPEESMMRITTRDVKQNVKSNLSLDFSAEMAHRTTP